MPFETKGPDLQTESELGLSYEALTTVLSLTDLQKRSLIQRIERSMINDPLNREGNPESEEIYRKCFQLANKVSLGTFQGKTIELIGNGNESDRLAIERDTDMSGYTDKDYIQKFAGRIIVSNTSINDFFSAESSQALFGNASCGIYIDNNCLIMSLNLYAKERVGGFRRVNLNFAFKFDKEKLEIYKRLAEKIKSAFEASKNDDRFDKELFNQEMRVLLQQVSRVSDVPEFSEQQLNLWLDGLTSDGKLRGDGSIVVKDITLKNEGE